ncbi:MAG: ornithine cyclodeaminase family protein [Kiloniellaceae bacterium]
MRIISAAEVEAALDYPSLVERLRQAFRRDIRVPVRHHHDIEVSGGSTATLLLMPAWQVDRHIGIKMVTVFPDNAAQDLPAVMGIYVLVDGKNGSPLALIDGPTLTVKRTAGASALASSYLSRPDAERLLMVGTGALAPQLIVAHAAVRPICNVLIWGRTPEKAQRLAKRMNRRDFRVDWTDDLESAARGADVISCATLSKAPLIQGDWLQPGQHIDLVGAFRPDMRETDDAVMRRARVFVDTRAGATKEGGDIVQAVAAGALSADDIAGDLFELTRGDRSGRRYYDQVTLFKSVGTAIEDLAAAQLVFERY